ncbi:MAG: helix-turn-helix transcriptional regulator [Armatimonadetes bacterium]|nr:helix-turn-helix transcriptional regulator [Armatimonadota bacterium]
MQPLTMTPSPKQIAAPAGSGDLREIAALFKALGDPTRLRIYQFLRAQVAPIAVDESGEVRPVSGPTVGEVCCHVTGKERVSSTISEHLKELRIAGLIVMERRGKNMICAVDNAHTDILAAFFAEPPALEDDCCPPDAPC